MHFYLLNALRHLLLYHENIEDDKKRYFVVICPDILHHSFEIFSILCI